MDKNLELITIQWALLEGKLAYYSPEVIHPTWKAHVTLSDFTYDALEIRAIALAKELGVEFVPYVGLPNTSSMKMIRSKLSHKKTDNMASCISKVVQNG